ncbi:MAG: sialidase family protein [Planctomycetaceae bacterium]|jgi:predicted neuraminidase
MRTVCVLIILQLAGFFSSALAEEVVHQRVFGPELPGRYKHPATFDQLDNGDLYLVYYGGTGEYGDDTAVYGSRLVKGTEQWTKPIAIADTPNRSEGNAVIWQAPDGVVWLFFLTRYGETWSTSRIKYKISKDGANSWSDSAMLAFEQGLMVRSRPIVLNDGDYLLPIYHETGNDRENVGDDTSSLFLRRNHKTGEWTETNRVYSRIGNLQPTPVQITDDYLVAYCRRGGGYGPMDDGFVVRTESRDGGWTWSPGKDTEFANPNSAVDMIRLKNGHLVLAYNDSKLGARMPLTVAVSTDGEKSWPHRRDVVNQPGDSAAYPNLQQTADGKIHLIYTSEGRTVINHLVFDESAILGHTK